MPRAKKLWTKVVEEAGVAVYLYERTAGGTVYRLVRTPGIAADRKSLGHSDRVLAEHQGRILARRISELRYAGHTSAVTLGQLISLYQRDALPLLSMSRQRGIRGMLPLLERHFTRAYELDNLSQHAIDGYVRARQSGALVSPRHRTGKAGVGAGTVRNELHLLSAMITWGQSCRVGGRRLLLADPMVGVKIIAEKNARQPVANEARYQALLAVAEKAERTGRFRCILTLARTTGRRIRAITMLRANDVLLTREQMRRALAGFGMDLAHADAWPQGAIRWTAATDKLGFEAITPISAVARAALDLYVREHPSLGDAPLFPSSENPSQPVGKEMAGYWLRKAERLAKLEHLDRGGYHAFRRAWASERRHLAATDVAAAGGWRSLEVMHSSYMHADAAGVQSVVEAKPVILNVYTAESKTTAPHQVAK